MSKLKQGGPAQSVGVDQAQDDRLATREKDKKQATGKRDEDLPGAEGPLSAGANEDTYD